MRGKELVCVLVGALLAGCSIEGPRQEEQQELVERDPARPPDATPEAIVGGSEAKAYSFAAVIDMLQNGYQVSSCSGAVIAPRIVLTAGHCAVGGFDGWRVLAPYAGPAQQVYAKKALVYDWTSTGGSVNPNQHDIALLVLDKPIALAAYPAIASSPVASGGKILNIGRIDDGYMNNKKLFVSQPISVKSGQGYGYPYDYAATEVIEPGDSGGPDVLPGSAPHTIVAVNSGAGGGIEVLARVDLLHGWIKAQIDANGGNNGPPPDPPPPQDPPQSPTCGHELCAEGAALEAACDPCAQQICAADSYCCSNSWDAQCVSEVASICSQQCGAPPADPEPDDPCGGVTYEGKCDGATLKWCQDKQLNVVDCAGSNKQCGWDQANSYYNCL